MARGDEDYNISASQVKSHAKCPKQWWFRYVSDKHPTKADAGYRALGSRVHESIEAALVDSPELISEKATRAAIQNAYADLEKYDVPDGMYEDGMKCCSTAASFIHNGPGSVPDDEWEPNIVDVEKRVEFEIERPDLSTGVTAIMDVCTESEIWDWKTGSIRDDTAHEERIQGSVYMAAFFDEYDEPPEVIRFVYLKEGKVRKLDPSDDNWNYMIKRAKALVRSKETGEFPAKPGDQCYWCDWEFWCPDAPTGVGNVPWEDY